MSAIVSRIIEGVLVAMLLATGTWVWHAESRIRVLEESAVSRELMTDLLVEYRLAQQHREAHPDDPVTNIETDPAIRSAVQEQFIRPVMKK
jgi:hypothetical protein